MKYERERQVAIEAVLRAAALCSAVRGEMVGAAFHQKDDQSPVTVADFGAQALICQRLAEAFPRDPIVAEEDADDLRKDEHALLLDQVTKYVRRTLPNATRRDICDWVGSGRSPSNGRFWTLDPIDGTKGFLRNDQYAVALALIEDGEVKIGVLACPALPLGSDQDRHDVGTLFVAVRGEGSTMASLRGGSATPIRISTDETAWRFVESVEAAHGNQHLQEAVAQAVGISRPALRMDSQAKYAAVARGDATLYLRLPSPKSPDYREKIWDHAAGSIIVEEADGRVTDMHGAPLDFTLGAQLRANRGVVVSNGVLHDATIEVLASVSSVSVAR